MKKLIVFLDAPDIHRNIFFDCFYKCNTDKSLSIEKYEPNEYYSKHKDHRMYSDVVNKCETEKIDYLFFPFLTYPEYLLAELKYRVNLKTKITITTILPSWHKSNIRAKVFYDLLSFEIIHKMFVSISDTEDIQYPNYAKFLKLHPKAKPWYEFAKETPKEYAIIKGDKRRYGFNQDDFCFLFFGSPYYGKGIDILLKAIPLQKSDAKFIIFCGEGILNFDCNLEEISNQPNVSFFQRKINEEDRMHLFVSCDAFILPYRDTYEHGSSAILVQAILAHKLAVISDFYPFNVIMEKYKIGKSFKTGDVEDLVKQIENLYSERVALLKNAKFDKYLSKMETWDMMLKEVIG